MTFRRRVYTIYRKELIDILRDRRTLIAMIVVPIVLYPLLMIGSIQAVSYQSQSFDTESLVIGVLSQRHGQMLRAMLEQDRATLEGQRAALDPESDQYEELPQPLDVRIVEAPGDEEELTRGVQGRRIQAGVVFGEDRLNMDPAAHNDIKIIADHEEPLSAHTAWRLAEMIERTQDRVVNRRLNMQRLPPAFVRPFKVERVNVSVPSSVLGQILPLVLVLMTITGAIYPAIDLTAGERERGTLESLMACPVPIIDLIVGKFLVVTTVAIMGATLNLASVSATVMFGGFDQVIASEGGGVPFGKMAFILVFLIPFAVLMSAIMLAVCSYARTFKEAQNYVTPVILAVLIPGGLAALPTTRFEGIMLVMPVGNMVLFARETLLGAEIAWSATLTVLLSTVLYAAAAVAVAASVFGQESVVFSDSGSLKAALTRRFIKPASQPSVSMVLLFVALMFPTWFFVQVAFQPGEGEDAFGLLAWMAVLMPACFFVLPALVSAYWKINLRSTFRLRMPSAIHLLAATLIGLSSWVPAYELNVLQQSIIPVPEAVIDSARSLEETLGQHPLLMMVLLLAVVPALCEELLFRGFLLSGLRSVAKPWVAVVVSACVFGVFHFFLFKLPVTVSLGVLLGFLCVWSRSIWPGVLAHLLHNGVGVVALVRPEVQRFIGLDPSAEGWSHYPIHIILIGMTVFIIGIVIAARCATKEQSMTDGAAPESVASEGAAPESVAPVSNR